MSQAFISIVGAKEHNLQNISLKIPREKLIVITGVSGSGKSSLAFDTLYAEGQRRYVESLSSYARQFLDQLKKPDVESIDGLSAAIAIEQKSVSKNPRSTVGTLTEIYDYLRLLFARIGKATCPHCHQEISSQSAPDMVGRLMEESMGQPVNILAPLVRERKGEYQKELFELSQSGYARVKVDGETKELSEKIILDKNKKHNIDVYIDRLILKAGVEKRLTTAIEIAFGLSDRLVKIEKDGNESIWSARFSCPSCNLSLPEIEPRLFSFNSPMGACSTCLGIGFHPLYEEISLALDRPWDISDLDLSDQPCEKCGGKRLTPEALAVKIQGSSISDVCAIPLDRAYDFFSSLKLSKREAIIGNRILKEITERLQFLLNVGVYYLTLDRRGGTLSGGEARRIRLASQIGSPLVGVLYVLDEPSIGLHPRDNEKLIASLQSLKKRGNTVITVEHDESTIRSADYIIDMGPGAGRFGGKIVSQGTLKQILSDASSLTGAYLSKRKKIDLPVHRRRPSKWIEIRGAQENNLKNISVKLPLGLLTCITGVSGSGKSTLIIDTLFKSLSQKLYKTKLTAGKHEAISGLEFIEQVVDVDQTPIGKTPRSNPSTYTGVFSHIRSFFSQLPESKLRGYSAGRFSFNVSGGRCEICLGAGLIRMEMHFLPDMYVQCEICQGERYNRETLEIRYKGKNISEVLNMTVEEALEFFKRIPQIRSKLKTLEEVGLSYIHLGQQATTLSGGEAQRIKLSKELSKRTSGKTLFILDEPTTGLHFDDIKKLLEVIQKLVDLGNTVIVIEHNLEVIKSADHVIDLGPEGGEKGGMIVAQGAPEEIARISSSYTGQFLGEIFASA